MSVTISAPLASPPQQFTNVPTLVETSNLVGVMLFLNGLLQTETLDFTRTGGVVTMVVPPAEGDVLTARVYVLGKALGGPGPTRYGAPWTLRLTGAFDGVSTTYLIAWGPTITGVCDGTNPIFVWQCTVPRITVFKNGILQTEGVDVAVGTTAMKFLPGAIPHPGDLITFSGYWP